MKTTRLVLSAGVLVLGPLLAATIRDNKDDIGLARRNQLEPPEFLDLTVRLAFACARRVDPSLTLDAVEQLVDLENFGAVFAACWGVSTPEAAPGEAPAVQAPPST